MALAGAWRMGMLVPANDVEFLTWLEADVGALTQTRFPARNGHVVFYELSWEPRQPERPLSGWFSGMA
jgi:hypothetical protein